MQIKAGDTVVVIAGKNKFTVDKKGNKTQTTGKVLKVYPCPKGKEECNALLDEAKVLIEKQLVEWRQKPLTER